MEFDLPAVVASTTGVSAIIRPDGSLAATSRPWEQDVLVDRLTVHNGRRWHAGPAIEWLATGGVLAAHGLMLARRVGRSARAREA